MIFLFVMLSMVMVLFLMTAATFSLFQLQVVNNENWRQYHQHESQYVFIAQQYQNIDVYKGDEIASKNKDRPKKELSKGKSYRLSPKIPIRSIIETMSVEGSLSLEQEQLYSICIRLLENIYSPLPFYSEYIQASGSSFAIFFENILKSIIEREKEGLKVNTSERLAEIEMNDPKDQFLLYKILRGQPFEHWDQGGIKISSIAPSLIHFIDLRDSKHKISLYKAPSYLLQAVINNEYWVDGILSYREDLYKRMRVDAVTKEQASLEFQDFLLDNDYISRYQELFDMRVSKSPPGKTTFYKTIIRDEKE